MVAGLVARHPERAADRRFESSPIRLISNSKGALQEKVKLYVFLLLAVLSVLSDVVASVFLKKQ